jgi:hypothetical protein
MPAIKDDLTNTDKQTINKPMKRVKVPSGTEKTAIHLYPG